MFIEPQNPAEKRLTQRELIICSFGPEYYRGVMWGSGISLTLLLGVMRRVHNRSKQTVAKAMQDFAKQQNVHETAQVHDRFSPRSISKRQEFLMDQKKKASSLYYVDIYAWAMLRISSIICVLKTGKFLLSYRNYVEFLYEEELAEEFADRILSQSIPQEFLTEEEENNNNNNSNESSKSENRERNQEKSGVVRNAKGKEDQEEQQKQRKLSVEEAKRELQQLEDAMRVKAISDFRDIAEMEKEMLQLEKEHGKTSFGDEHEHSGALPESGLVMTQESLERAATARGNSGGPMSATKRKQTLKAGQLMPNFWDGIAVGFVGSLVDADVPTQPIMKYLNMGAGWK